MWLVLPLALLVPATAFLFYRLALAPALDSLDHSLDGTALALERLVAERDGALDAGRCRPSSTTRCAPTASTRCTGWRSAPTAACWRGDRELATLGGPAGADRLALPRRHLRRPARARGAARLDLRARRPPGAPAGQCEARVSETLNKRRGVAQQVLAAAASAMLVEALVLAVMGWLAIVRSLQAGGEPQQGHRAALARAPGPGRPPRHPARGRPAGDRAQRPVRPRRDRVGRREGLHRRRRPPAAHAADGAAHRDRAGAAGGASAAARGPAAPAAPGHDARGAAGQPVAVAGARRARAPQLRDGALRPEADRHRGRRGMGGALGGRRRRPRLRAGERARRRPRLPAARDAGQPAGQRDQLRRPRRARHDPHRRVAGRAGLRDAGGGGQRPRHPARGPRARVRALPARQRRRHRQRPGPVDRARHRLPPRRARPNCSTAPAASG